MFALRANSMRDHPDGGMIEEQGFRCCLQHVDHVVVTTDVRELVDQDGLELLA
jgi:hypothetical protein